MHGDVLDRLPAGAKVAIIRLRSLGDCVLTTPAIALLKRARPDLRIGVVVEERFAPVFSGNPDVDVMLAPDAGDIARWSADLVLNLHGGTRSVQLTMASRAPWRAGFSHFRLQSLYNIRIPRAQEILGVDRKVHTAEHLVSAVFHLGVPLSEIPRARLFAATAPPAHAYAVLHPAASEPGKTWPAERFMDVGRHLQERLQLDPVFIAGPGESLAAFSTHRTVPGAPLEEIKTLLAGAALFVGNDSGPAHMAAAFGLPVVVMFGASDPEIWAPWKTECAVLACAHGIAGIDTSQAIAAIAALAPQPVV